MTQEEKIPSIYDKEWQEKKELGKFSRTFDYIGKNGQPAQVTTEVTIHPGQQYELLEQQNMKADSKGVKRLDSKIHGRSIMKLVYGLDGHLCSWKEENKLGNLVLSLIHPSTRFGLYSLVFFIISGDIIREF